MRNPFPERRSVIGCALMLAAGAFFVGCHHPGAARPVIEILEVPHAAVGGPDRMENIGGRVKNAQPGQRVVLYAHSGSWWIQPLANDPFTRIQPDATWRNSTHLGNEYAALVVEADYRPAPKLVSLPPLGSGVAALDIVPGQAPVDGSVASLNFSGYDWTIRSAGSDRGGEPNEYDPANAWTDKNGYLHLRMGERNGRWSCAEVSLTRSLGYGTYRFTVEDVSRLSPSAVFGIFTWVEGDSQNLRDEMDLEISRCGDPHTQNAQYAIQPFYLRDNLYRFSAPSGVLVHTLRWDAKAVSFETTSGRQSQARPQRSFDHTFTSNLPVPGHETLHLDLYDYHHSENGRGSPPAEVVIESFQFSRDAGR